MKKFTTLITFLLLCAATLFGQAPEKFTYQAVVRNASNSLVANSPVGVRISILQGGVAGTLVFMENHTAVTNANGLVTIVIGSGNLQQGSLSDIEWGESTVFLKTEIDPTGGSNYTITSTQQLLSVPYALYANEAGNRFSGDYNDLTNTPSIPTVPTNVSTFTNDAGYITMDSVPTVPTNVSAFANDAGYITGYTETDPQYNAWDKDYNDLINRPTIPTVPTNVSAFTNDAGYITMDSVPTVPTNVSAFANDAGYITGYTETDPQYNAWDKDYNDLINRPTIPTVPTNVSAFTNDAGYITMDSVPAVPTNVSAFNNDAGYITMDSVPTVPANVSAFANDVGYITGYTETDPLFNAWDKDYNDLINRPTIPTVPTNVSAFANDAGYLTNFTEQQILSISNDTIFLTGGSFVKLPAGFDGDYNSLTNTPEIPTVPTNVSAFTNDAEYITANDMPTQVNADWEAEEGVAFILNKPNIPEIPENVSTFTNDAGYITSAELFNIINALNDRLDSLQNIIENGGDIDDTSSHHDNFDFAQLPTVATLDTIGNLTQNSVKLGGLVIDDGGGVLLTAGICYDTSATPTVSGNNIDQVYNSSQISLYSPYYYNFTNLSPGVTYYARAYATNNKGIAYGETISFTTPIATETYGTPCPGMPTVTDIDGNVYNTVQIGDQCWMRENLRVTKTPSGTEIKIGLERFLPGGMDLVEKVGYKYDPNIILNGSQTSSTVPSGVQGICPDGWHLPSKIEWENLFAQVGNTSEWLCDNGTIGKALADATFWAEHSGTCTIGNNILDNNKSGFSALPTKDQHLTYYASCTNSSNNSNSSSSAVFDLIRLQYNVDSVMWASTYYNDYKKEIVVRCLRDYSYLPVIQLNDVSRNGANSVKVVSNVTFDGTTELLARGICWSSEENPTIEDNYINDSVVLGLSQTIISNLESGVNYYFRAFATNSIGTVYSNQIVLQQVNDSTGIPCPGIESVIDYDGNWYSTVQIGNQCWMKQNLRTTHYANGEEISLGNTTSSTMAYRYNPNGDNTNVSNYGYLYNRVAVMHCINCATDTMNIIQGICPEGWHVPNAAEWEQLESYLGSQSQFVCGDDNHNIAKSLASNEGWITSSKICAIGNDQLSNNTTSFSAYPAGDRGTNSYSDFGKDAYFWSTSSKVDLWYNAPKIIHDSYSLAQQGYSVRCLNDTSYGGGGSDSSLTTLPVVTTDSITAITSNSATCGGNVTSDGGAEVTARGVCWSTSNTPSINDLHTMDGTGVGAFTSSVTHLLPGTIYYIRAYATNSVGTAYGEEISFTTPNIPHGDASPCPGTPTVTDHEGNVYNTVKIGNQCWTKENMRCTTSPSTGTYLIPEAGTTHTYSGKQARWYNNSATYANQNYGLLYNWNAAVDTFNTSYGETSVITSSNYAVNALFSGNRRGICPEGWHVPSDAEWTELVTYVSSQPVYRSEYDIYHDSTWIAKALSLDTLWSTNISTCAVGNNVSINNSTQFSAVPAGIFQKTDYSGGSSISEFQYRNNHAHFWSSTQNGTNAKSRFIVYDAPNIKSNYSDYGAGKGMGMSVRCLRD